MVRGTCARWNNQLGCSMVGEGDWNPGGKNNRNGADIVGWAAGEQGLNQDRLVGLEIQEGSGR